jgi:SAM-dependent methyltransferase
VPPDRSKFPRLRGRTNHRPSPLRPLRAAPDHFSSVAATYAAFRPSYPPALVDALADAAPRREVAWDVGCGTGQLSIGLAARFERVIATDLSPKLLAAATRHPRVEYRAAPAEASGLATASADLIVAAQAAHWFDMPRFTAECERVGRPGALVALIAYGNLEVAGEAKREIDHYHHATVGAYWPSGREHVENGYRDLVLPWTSVAAPAIAMTATWSRDELAGYISSWSATARYIERHGREAFEALCARLSSTWPDHERREVRWPLVLKMARLDHARDPNSILWGS